MFVPAFAPADMRFALMCFALLAVANKAFQLGAAPRLVARPRGALLVLQEPARDTAKASLGMVSDYALNWIGKGADAPSQPHELVASPPGDHVWVSSSLDLLKHVPRAVVAAVSPVRD